MRSFFLITLACFFVFFCQYAYSTEFDELDKPPEGAHQGQMLLGAFISVGIPKGNTIKAEEDFVKNSTYTFPNETTKLIEVSHLSFGIGVSYEYMPMDYLGAKAKIRRTYVVQQSNFGTEYKNWRGYLYRDFSFYIGPSFHATSRTTWDFTLTPVIGYAFAQYEAATVASQIVTGFSGNNKRDSKGFSFGAELNCTIYFSGGLFISLGGEWLRNSLSFGKSFTLTNPFNPGANYLDGKKSGTLDSYSFIITSGYAFSN